VAFPKLVNVPHKSEAELDTMWMVGFLDHEKRTEKELALKDLSHFVSLPGGRLMPAASAQLRKIYNKDRNKLNSAERRLKKLTPGQRKRVLGNAVSAARLSEDHVLRLQELARTKGGISDNHKKKKKKRPWELYLKETRKIRRSFKDKNLHNPTCLRSRAFENLFYVERESMQAAVSIQRSYRIYQRRLFWKSVVVKSRACMVIQRYARGFIARSLVRVWLIRRSWLVIVSQSATRGKLGRMAFVEKRQAAEKAALVLQRIVRGYIGRLKCDLVRSCVGARRIQSYWRGCIARVAADKKWVQIQVTKIQRIARGFVDRMRVSRISLEINFAAIVIQRSFRGIVARWMRSLLLFERENNNRRMNIQLLRAEDSWICEEMAKLNHKLENLIQIEPLIESAKATCDEMEDVLLEKEWNYISLQREKKQVDPLAIRQGWSEELDKYIEEHRDWVTNAKFEFVFIGATYYRQLLVEKDMYIKQLREYEFQLETLEIARKRESEELYQRENARNWETKRRLRRRKVADQKRMWRVQWFTADGKTDSRRRPGYAWEPEVYSGAERDTFNIGSVDLVQDNDSTLQNLFSKVALQNSQNQIVQHGALLAPLMDGMEHLTQAVVKLSMQNSISPGELLCIEDIKDDETS